MELIEVWQRQKYGEKNMNPYYIVKVYRHTPEQPYEKMFGKEFEKTGRWSTIDAVFATRTGVWLPQEMRLVLGIDGYNARVQDRAAFFNEVAQTLGLYGGGPSTESEIAESPRGLLQVNAELRATDEKGDYFWRKFVDEQTLQGIVEKLREGGLTYELLEQLHEHQSSRSQLTDSYYRRRDDWQYDGC